MMSALPLASAGLIKQRILCLNDLLDAYLYKQRLFPHVFFFSVFKHDFIRYVDFTHIAASNTASDVITNYVTHRIVNTDLIYFCAHCVIEIDEKSSFNGGC